MGIACRAPRANRARFSLWVARHNGPFYFRKKILTASYLVYLKPRLAAGHIATKIKNIIFRHHFASSVVAH